MNAVNAATDRAARNNLYDPCGSPASCQVTVSQAVRETPSFSSSETMHVLSNYNCSCRRTQGVQNGRENHNQSSPSSLPPPSSS